MEELYFYYVKFLKPAAHIHIYNTGGKKNENVFYSFMCALYFKNVGVNSKSVLGS